MSAIDTLAAPSRSRISRCACTASSECPPRAKKLSLAPTFGTPRTRDQIAARSAATEEAGASKAAVAANTGAGPDIILSTNDDANLYPEKLLDVTDLCEYLGKKYGGWYPACEAYLRPDGKKWIGLALGAAGSYMVYRQSQVKAAGFDSFPKDTAGFLAMFKALKEKGTPGGMALGNATGDGLWCNWLVWSHGGMLVDKNNKVVIDSAETIKGRSPSCAHRSRSGTRRRTRSSSTSRSTCATPKPSPVQ